MSSGPRGAGLGLKLLIGAGALAYGVKEATYTVEGGQRAIIFNRIGGMQMDTVLAEGLHFRIPWFQYPIIYDIRARPRKISSLTGSKDLQMVNIALRVLSRPLASNLQPAHPLPAARTRLRRARPALHRQRGAEERRGQVQRFTAHHTESAGLCPLQVSLLIRRELFERAKDFNIILDDVAITELSFSREYTAAVEAKQVAQQEAQRAQFYVEKAKQDQRQKIIQAEGEAQAAKMLGEAVTKNPGYLKLRKIRAAQNIAKTVSQSQNKVYLSADSLVLNLQDKDSFKQFEMTAIRRTPEVKGHSSQKPQRQKQSHVYSSCSSFCSSDILVLSTSTALTSHLAAEVNSARENTSVEPPANQRPPTSSAPRPQAYNKGSAASSAATGTASPRPAPSRAEPSRAGLPLFRFLFRPLFYPQTMADTQVDSGSDISAKDLKEKKLVEEKENGKDAATNGKENEENGEPDVDDEEDEEVDEEDEEDDGEGDEEDDEDDDDEIEGGTKRAAEDDEDDDEVRRQNSTSITESHDVISRLNSPSSSFFRT
ncbi:hypothetical protein L3Q82_021060, partial [Scortum barcoo]